MRRLLEDNPRNKETIFPYIGGEEVNTSPTHAHHRYMINFWDYPLRRADAGELWADADAVPGNGAAPEAGAGQRDGCRHTSDAEPAGGVASGVSAWHQGELWAEADAKRRRELRRQAVVPEDYPGPVAADWPELLGIVEEKVKPERAHLTKNAIYDYRTGLMIDNNEGLTKTYNRFHDPNKDSPAIAKLRNLHEDMDRAILNAYGWQDIPTTCEFLLDYEIDEETWGTKKKPYRYRWPNEVRDEVLARLLELNAERAAEEKLS